MRETYIFLFWFLHGAAIVACMAATGFGALAVIAGAGAGDGSLALFGLGLTCVFGGGFLACVASVARGPEGDA